MGWLYFLFGYWLDDLWLCFLLDWFRGLLFMFGWSLLFWGSNNFGGNLLLLFWFLCGCCRFSWWFFIVHWLGDYWLFNIWFFSCFSFIYYWSFRTMSWRLFMIYFILTFMLLFFLLIILSLFFLMLSTFRLNWIFFITNRIFICKIWSTGSASNSCGRFRLDIFVWDRGSMI